MATYFSEISVHTLARTKVDREAVRAWLDELGADQFEIPPEEAVSDPALQVALLCREPRPRLGGRS